MVDIQTSFSFKNGELFDYDKMPADEDVITAMYNIELLFRPTIEKHKLSGRIVVTITNGKLHIGYKEIEPIEFALVLVAVLENSADPDFSLN